MHSTPLCLLPGILGIYTHSEMHAPFYLVATTIPGPAGPVQRLSRHAATLPPSACVPHGIPVPRAGPPADASEVLQEACSPGARAKKGFRILNRMPQQ